MSKVLINAMLILSVFSCTCVHAYAQDKKTTAKVVYHSANGKKYHTHKDCQYIRNSKEVKQTSEQQAKKDSLTICKRCESKDNKAKEEKK